MPVLLAPASVIKYNSRPVVNVLLAAGLSDVDITSLDTRLNGLGVAWPTSSVEGTAVAPAGAASRAKLIMAPRMEAGLANMIAITGQR